MFIESAFGLVVFLLFFGGLFLWFAKNESLAVSPSEKRIGSVINVKTIMVLFALLYFSLAHFTMYGALALSVEYDNNAPCENLLMNSTTNGTLTINHYADSCQSITTPAVLETYFTLFTWLLYIDLFALMLGTLVLTFRFFGSVL